MKNERLSSKKLIAINDVVEYMIGLFSCLIYVIYILYVYGSFS